MKHNWSRFGVGLLCLMLLTGLMGVPMEAGAAVEDSGTCGDNLTWTLDSDGTLTISGTGPMENYEQWGTPWYEMSNRINAVSIQNGVTSIGECAFADCDSLTSVTIPDSVTFIGGGAFYYCDRLTSITISDSVTSIGDRAFSACYRLTGIYVDESNPEYSSDLYGVLFNKNQTHLIQVPGAIQENYTIPDSVASIGKSALSSCGSLTSVTIPDSVAFIGDEAFSFCTSLTSVTIPASIMSIGDFAFSNCWNLTGIYVDESNPEYSSDSYGVLFNKNKTHLIQVPGAIRKNYTIPDSVASIGDEAFYFCRSLIGVTIPDSVTSIGDSAFSFCDSLTSVTIPNGVTSIGDGAFSYCESLTSIAIPDGVTSIDDGAFRYCDSLTSVTIPDSVTSIGAGAFDYCSSLTGVTIPAGVTSIGANAFVECYALTDVTFQGDAPSIGYNAFERVTASAYYPASSGTWTEDKLQNYGGNLTWIPVGEAHTHIWDKGTVTTAATCTNQGVKTYTCECGEIKTEPVPVTAHTEVTDSAVESTCTETGLTEGKHCSVCDAVTVKQETVPAKGHNFADGSCTVCGEKDPDWVEPTEPEETEPTEPEATEPSRVAGANRFDTAFVVADQMKANLGIEKFDAVVVASGTNFADALSGSYLSAAKNAPILLSFTTDAINNGVKDYIRENLNEGGTVYILGGESAVPASFETGLEGFEVKRLAGGNRFETNLMILEEAGVGDKPVLVCTGLGFADSLSASAAKLPILLVWNDLTDGQKALLDNLDGNKLYIIGGESAVSTGMEEQLKAYGETERVAGGNRFETSVAIAETFFSSPKSAVLAYAWNFPDGLCGGPLAATMDAPLILTMDKFEAKAAEYVQNWNIRNGTILGGEGLISEATVNNIFN